MHSRTSGWKRVARAAVVAVSAALLIQGSAQAQSGTWTSLVDAQAWDTSTNWAGGTVANGANNTANFNTLDIVDVGAPFYRQGVRLDTNRTIGNIIFGDTNAATPGSWDLYTDNASTLTLAGTTPTITVNPVGPIDTGTPPPINDVIIRPNLFADDGLTKAGNGVLTIAGGTNDGLHGTVNVAAGTLRVGPTVAFDYETVVDPQRTQFHLVGGTVLEAESTVGDIAAAGAGISIAPGQTVTIRKLGATTSTFSEVTGLGSTVNLEAATGNMGLGQNWAASGALAAVNMTGTTVGTPSIFQLRIVGASFNPASFAGTNVSLTNASVDPVTNSFGNTIPIGALTGDATSTLQGASNGTRASYEIGALNTDTTYAGGMTTGTGGVNLFKVGTGKLTLTGNLTYTSTINALPDLRGGITRVSAGTLALTGMTAIPGGVVDVTLGNLFTTIDLQSGGTLDVSGASSTYSTAALQQVIGTGTIVGPYSHSQGNLRPGDVTFGDSNTTTSAAGKLTFANTLNISGGMINYDLAPAGVVGDYNSNNIVDAADYTLWRNNLNTNNPLPNRAGGNTGTITQADYTAWKSNFGETAAGGGELIQVGGGVLGGNVVVDVGALTGAGAGTYTVINSATPLTGTIAGWSVNWTGRGTTPTLVQTANQVQLNAAALVPPVTVNWRGDQSAIWDAGAAGTSNWQNTSTNAADKFFSRDTAQFLDTYDGVTAPTTTTVTLNSIVTPGAVVVNSTANYTISGTGRISGASSFVKQGTGRLSIATNNNFSGGSTISGGVVDLEGTGVLGSREITLAGGHLHAGNAGTFNLNNDLVISGTGNVLSNNNVASQTLNARGRISGSGTLALENNSEPVTPPPVVNGIDFFGDNTSFTGKLNFTGPTPVFLRYRSVASAGTNVAVDVGNNGSTMAVLTGVNSIFTLGSLTGGAMSIVGGHESGGGAGTTTYRIGTLNTSTEFAGVIRNGRNDTPNNYTFVTKIGSGTLTLAGTNTYFGDTRIESGVLRTTTATVLSDMTAITLLAGTTLNLDFDGVSLGADTVRGLIIPGATQAIGTWGSLASTATFKNAFLTGNGLLNVTAIIAQGSGSLGLGAVPEPTSVMLILMGICMLAATGSRRRG